jgi:hypothetical protein
VSKTQAPKNTGKFEKGNRGKPKGATNKVTRELKEMILKALDGAGGIQYLQERAKDPRTARAFLTLVGKVLPLTVAGDPQNPVQTVARIELVAVSADQAS